MMKVLIFLMLFCSTAFLMNIELNSSFQIIKKNKTDQKKLKQTKNGQNITDQVQEVMRKLINNANTLFGPSKLSHAIYLSKNLQKFYKGDWSVIISNVNDKENSSGIVMFYKEDWWAIWVGQNSLYRDWTYYFYKLNQFEPYLYQHFQITSYDDITGKGLNEEQAKKLRILASQIGFGTIFQQANQLSIRAEDIVSNCKWNTFIIQKNGFYAGYFAVKQQRYLTGSMTDSNGKISAYYILVCVNDYYYDKQIA